MKKKPEKIKKQKLKPWKNNFKFINYLGTLKISGKAGKKSQLFKEV
jgi:hypothetical protein